MTEPLTSPLAPIIVAATFSAADFRWLDDLRRTHFPPERNQLSAHLTLFHHLPPSVAPELVGRLKRLAERACPPASIAGVINLGKGVALRVRSDELDDMRAELADAVAGLLTPQDANGFRAHVTIQNKAPASEARTLHARMTLDFQPRPLSIVGLAAHWYRGGPWERFAAVRFRGAR